MFFHSDKWNPRPCITNAYQHTVSELRFTTTPIDCQSTQYILRFNDNIKIDKTGVVYRDVFKVDDHPNYIIKRTYISSSSRKSVVNIDDLTALQDKNIVVNHICILTPTHSPTIMWTLMERWHEVVPGIFPSATSDFLNFCTNVITRTQCESPRVSITDFRRENIVYRQDRNKYTFAIIDMERIWKNKVGASHTMDKIIIGLATWSMSSIYTNHQPVFDQVIAQTYLFAVTCVIISLVFNVDLREFDYIHAGSRITLNIPPIIDAPSCTYSEYDIKQWAMLYPHNNDGKAKFCDMLRASLHLDIRGLCDTILSIKLPHQSSNRATSNKRKHKQICH